VEGRLGGGQPADEFEVEGLRGQPRVDQHKDVGEVGTPLQVIGHGLVELVAFALGDLGVAVAGQVHEAPAVVDGEEVDQAGLAGRAGDLGEAAVAGEEIDQRGFTDVGSTDKGELGPVVHRAGGQVRGAGVENGGEYLHRPP